MLVDLRLQTRLSLLLLSWPGVLFWGVWLHSGVVGIWIGRLNWTGGLLWIGWIRLIVARWVGIYWSHLGAIIRGNLIGSREWGCSVVMDWMSICRRVVHIIRHFESFISLPKKHE